MSSLCHASPDTVRRHAAFGRAAKALALAAGLAGAGAVLSPHVAMAQSIPDDVIVMEVLPGWRTEAGTRMVGLRLTLAPGWKTYWRAPGDAGIPPAFSWEGSRNIEAAQLHWPVPEVWHQNGMRSIGYSGQVVIPLELTTPETGAEAAMKGEVQVGVCEDICIPVTLSFDALLPVTSTRDPAIVAALVDRPLTATEAGVGRVTCAAEVIPDGLRLSVDIEMPAVAGQEVVVVETADPDAWVSEADTARDGSVLTAQVDVVSVSDHVMALDREGLRFTVLGGGSAVDIEGCTAR